MNARPNHLLCVFACAAVLLICLGSDVMAQTTGGTIEGTVTDPSGAIIAGATIDVINVETGIKQAAISGPQGRFRVPNLLVGEYEVQGSMVGFQTVVRTGIRLTVGSQIVVDLSLPIGQSQETVTVTAEAVQVDTTSIAIANLVEATQMRELPLDGRNYQQLLTLAPGVVTMPGNLGFYGNQENYSIAGSRSEGYASLLDNTNVTNFWNHGGGSGALGTSLGVDAIAEFQTLTSTYSPQFGGGGAVVNAVTKSGTNSFHGSAYYFMRHSALDARNFSDPGDDPPPFRKHQFGGTLGGPIIKDKAFFFANYEGIRQLRGVSRVASVPDENALKGLLPIGPGGSLVDVGIAPEIAPLLKLYVPATTPTGNGIGLRTMINNEIGNENYFLGRFDYKFSDKGSLFVRYVSDRSNFVQPYPIAASLLGLWPERDYTANQYFTIGETHTLAANVINQARISYVRARESVYVDDTIPGLQYFPEEGRQSGYINVSGITGLGPSVAFPYYTIPNRFTLGDDVMWTKGAHNLSFGFSVTRLREDTTQEFLAGGMWIFQSLQDLLQNRPFLFQGALPGQADSVRDFLSTQFALYFNDQWKVTRKLTLNLGLRYEPSTNITERRNKLQALINAPHGTGYEPVPAAFVVNPSLKNFNPRVGFAYDVFGNQKTSVRGSFGMFHNLIQGRTIAPNYWMSPPFATAQQLFPTFPYPFAGGDFASVPAASQGVAYNVRNTPYMMQYNLNVQHDLGADMILSIGYIGSRGVHLFGMREINPPVPEINEDGKRVFAELINGRIVSNPRVNPLFGSISMAEPVAQSNYNSLQVSLNHRMSRNWQAQISYTFSKSLDDSSSTTNNEAGGSSNQSTQDPFNRADDYARSAFDRRHNLRISSVIGLPFDQNQLVSGWQLSWILSAMSGGPITPMVGFDQRGFQASFANETSRANSTGTCSNPIIGKADGWFNPECYSLPGVGELGNAGRNSLQGPGLFNVDIALSKATKISSISEAFAIQFRAEAFNVFNRTNLGNPSTGLFLQGPNGTGIPNPNAGKIFGAGRSRQMQFGLKVLF